MSDVTKAVEAAAKAIIRGRASDGDSLSQGLTGAALESYVNAHWNWWETDAQRAIAAFLDAVKDAPTEEMLDGGAFYFIHGAGAATEHEKNMAKGVWRAMCLALRRGVES